MVSYSFHIELNVFAPHSIILIANNILSMFTLHVYIAGGAIKDHEW